MGVWVKGASCVDCGLTCGHPVDQEALCGRCYDRREDDKKRGWLSLVEDDAAGLGAVSLSAPTLRGAVSLAAKYKKEV